MQSWDAAALLSGLCALSGDVVVVSDPDDVVLWASEPVRALFGWEPAELQGCPAEVLLPPEARATRAERLRLVRAGHACPPYADARLRRDGSLVPVEVRHGPLLDAGGELAGAITVFREITESEQALKLSEALHRAIVETAQEGILATDGDGLTILANQSLANILGRPMGSLYHREVRELVEQHDPSSDGERRSGRSRFEFDYEHPDRGHRTLSVFRRPLPRAGTGEPGSLWMVSDVTDARAAESKLRRLALHDAVTDLPNRYLLMDRIELAAARLQRGQHAGMAVLFIDLDDFKEVNDTHGHAAGDAVLLEVGRRLAASVRASDTVGRLGGDEFAVVCEDTDLEGALLVAARVHQALDRPVQLADGSVKVTVSVGVATAPRHEPLHLLREADDAMYRIKQDGGGRTAVADAPPAG